MGFPQASELDQGPLQQPQGHGDRERLLRLRRPGRPEEDVLPPALHPRHAPGHQPGRLQCHGLLALESHGQLRVGERILVSTTLFKQKPKYFFGDQITYEKFSSWQPNYLHKV